MTTHALVTGSSSGIGKAIAQALLAQGYAVTGFDVAQATIADARFSPVRVDLCDVDATEQAARSLGRVDAIVHAAGVMRVGALGELSTADGALMWKLHVESVTRLANVLMPRMIEARSGRVVLIGSRVAQGKALRSQYAATKAALVGLARSWAAEAIAAGVTVNVVSPAATETAMLEDPARKSAIPMLPPIGRLIRPDEIAALVVFLLSDTAGAITGQDIQVCGGASLPR
ncbi:MAG: SDR family oxidoreductase [Burkholderiales bacterium]